MHVTILMWLFITLSVLKILSKLLPVYRLRDTYIYINSVPSEDPSGLTIVLRPNKFVSIRNAARVRSKAEIQREYEITKAEKDAAMVSCPLLSCDI